MMADQQDKPRLMLWDGKRVTGEELRSKVLEYFRRNRQIRRMEAAAARLAAAGKSDPVAASRRTVAEPKRLPLKRAHTFILEVLARSPRAMLKWEIEKAGSDRDDGVVERTMTGPLADLVKWGLADRLGKRQGWMITPKGRRAIIAP